MSEDRITMVRQCSRCMRWLELDSCFMRHHEGRLGRSHLCIDCCDDPYVPTIEDLDIDSCELGQSDDRQRAMRALRMLHDSIQKKP